MKEFCTGFGGKELMIHIVAFVIETIRVCIALFQQAYHDEFLRADAAVIEC